MSSEKIVGDGDLDGNLQIDSIDIVILKNHLLKQINCSSDQLIHADVNSESKIDVFDLIRIKSMLIKPKLPVPESYSNTHINEGNPVEDFISIAETQLGFFSPANTANKYTYANGYISGKPDNGYGYPWCAAFVSWCARQANIEGNVIKRTASCWNQMEQFQNQGFCYLNVSHGGLYTPVRGDIVYFNWNGETSPDHVGIVIKVSGDTLYTIEGNADNSVKNKSYSLSSKTVVCFGHPLYNENNILIDIECGINYPRPIRTIELTSPQTSGFDVMWLQTALTLLGYPVDMDGYYGPKTQVAVKHFQVDYNLDVNGVFGPISLSKMIELLMLQVSK